MKPSPLPNGIVSVLQTPFDQQDKIDFNSLERLIEAAIAGGVTGFLVPVVASEVAFLSQPERKSLLSFVIKQVNNRVAVIAGASHDDIKNCRRFAEQAHELAADAWLLAVPQRMYKSPDEALDFFRLITRDFEKPLVIQDFQFNGPGLPLAIIERLKKELPLFKGIKIEISPSGPKYTAVRDLFGEKFWVAGGWAVTQLIEALDRGVNAMIPESSMVAVYSTIYQLYRQGHRSEALNLFRRLQPLLSFSNQDVATSIAFFKKLLVKKKIFRYPHMRQPGFAWDQYNSRIAAELVDLYLEIEGEIVNPGFSKRTSK